MSDGVAVIFGGPSPEHDISILTGLQVCRVLARAGDDITAIYWSKTGSWHTVSPELEAAAFLTGVPREARPLHLSADGEGFTESRSLGRQRPLGVSVVVNCCHGGPGEDGTLQGVLDLAGVRYTGPSQASAALGMDKLAFGALMESAGIPTLARRLLEPSFANVDLPAPWILKPRFGGSSLGIEVVEDVETARSLATTSSFFADGAVVEPFVADSVDLNVSVRSVGTPSISMIERPLKSEGGFYNYAEKYLSGSGLASAPRELPAKLPETVEREITELAARVAALAGLRGLARIDFLWRGDEVWVNEINTIPGAMSFYLWRESGVGYDDLVRSLISEATASPAARWSTSGADGLALRSATDIARKLS